MKKPQQYAASVLGAGLISIAGNAQAATPTPEELLKQIQALQVQLEALQNQVKQQANNATKAPVPDGVATKEDIDGLRALVEDRQYANDRTREYNTATTSRGLKIGGTLTTTYTATQGGSSASTSVNPGGATTSNSFDVGGTLNFSGNLHRDYSEGRNLDYKFGLSLGKPKLATTTTTTGPQQGDNTIAATDVYLQYAFRPTNGGLENPIGTITVGQQKVPFGLEAQAADELKPTVSSAQFLAGLNNINKRQIGIVVRGDIAPTVDYGFNYRAPLIEYAFGVANGAGPNTTDDNNSKDWFARTAFTLPVDYYSVFRELKFGISRYQGSKKLNSAGAGNPVLVNNAKSNRNGFDIYYNHNPFGVTYEMAYGVDEVLATPSSLTSSSTRKVTSRGQYVTLFYNFGDQFKKNLTNVGKYDDAWPATSQIYFRYDVWDPDTVVDANEVLKNTFGYNLFFAETTKLQVGITRTLYKDHTKRSANDLTALFQYGF